MKIDKKSLISCDIELHQKHHQKLQNDLKSENIRNNEYLTKDKIKDWLEKGIFKRRLKFSDQESSFYIAPINIFRGNGRAPDYKFYDNFIISYWGDPNKRAERLMTFEIGDSSPANGTLELIGEYNPKGNNLLDVKYETIAGKEYINNAISFLEGKEATNDLNQRIDIDSFFRLKFELAAQGMQARALYDNKNCIIDGAAGTGKSTIAIQKLKYFFENDQELDQNQLLIVVRNRYLKKHFSTLLKDSVIDLRDIKIQTMDEVFDTNAIKNIEECIEESKRIQRNLNELIQKRDIDSLEVHYLNLYNFIGVEFFQTNISILLSHLNTEKNIQDIEKLDRGLEELQNKRNQYIDLNKNEINALDKAHKYIKDSIKKLKDKSLQYDEKVQVKNEIKKIREALSSNKISQQIKFYDSEIKKHKNDIDKLDGKHYQKALNSLTPSLILPIAVLDDLIDLFQNRKEASGLEVLKWFIQYKNHLQDKEKLLSTKNEFEIQLRSEIIIKEQEDIENEIIELNKKLDKKFENANRKYFDLYSNEMKKVYFSKYYLDQSGLIQNNHHIIYNILNILPKRYNTIIIDEAQDFSKQELEFIRIHTERVILTGDILQNIETDKGLKDWNEIFNLEHYRNENDNDKLNIYSLKHNFRQTYQLANASYNYRKLLLNEEVEDIGSDYFESEKFFNSQEYPKPKILFFENLSKAMEHLDNKKKHIFGTYTKKFPIIAVYKNDQDRKYLEKICSDFSIATKKIDRNADIILLHINEVKGEEFPIVFANANSFSDKELYLIMTRAQFELDLFSLEANIDNKYLQQLGENKWIDVENINFITDEKEKDLNNNKDRSIVDDVNIEPHQLEDKETVEQNKEVYYEEKPFDSDLEIANVIENFERNNEGAHTQLKKTKEKPATTRENIPKHEADVTQYDEDLDPDLITDEEQYKKDFKAKIIKDLKKYSNEKQSEIIQKIRYVNKSTIKNKGDKTQIKYFLHNTYKGYCQICGFTFRKSADQKNSFEVFNWNDKRVVKNKKSFVTTADSLCLCRNCSANIKWGAFEPSFINTINRMENFETKDIDQIKDELNKIIDNNTAEIFKEYLDFDDMYALEISLNKEPKNIYYTNGHLIQFIVYLQLENDFNKLLSLGT